MIYFGWAGYGPWHSWNGFAWFLLGILFTIMLASFAANWRSGHRYLITLVLTIISTAVLAGYYAWFAGVRAQAGDTTQDYYHCKYERELCAQQLNKLFDEKVKK